MPIRAAALPVSCQSVGVVYGFERNRMHAAASVTGYRKKRPESHEGQYQDGWCRPDMHASAFPLPVKQLRCFNDDGPSS